MKLLFADRTQINVELIDNPASKFITKCIKHLQHIDVESRDWDNPFDKSSPDLMLRGFAQQLKVPNLEIARLSDQCYLNFLHEIYEKNYNGNTVWLDFHEQIHRCEKNANIKTLMIDWREKSGPLIKKFDHAWTKYTSNYANKGDVYIEWSELGKTPYSYWRDNEPDNLNRLCELAKPWIHLRPKFDISLEYFNFLENQDNKQFKSWWEKYHDSWCKYWQIPSWSMKDQFSVIKIGKVLDIELLENVLKQQIKLQRVLL